MLLRPSYVELFLLLGFSSPVKERGSYAKAARKWLFRGERISDNTRVRTVSKLSKRPAAMRRRRESRPQTGLGTESDGAWVYAPGSLAVK